MVPRSAMMYSEYHSLCAAANFLNSIQGTGGTFSTTSAYNGVPGRALGPASLLSTNRRFLFPEGDQVACLVLVPLGGPVKMTFALKVGFCTATKDGYDFRKRCPAS